MCNFTTNTNDSCDNRNADSHREIVANTNPYADATTVRDTVFNSEPWCICSQKATAVHRARLTLFVSICPPTSKNCCSNPKGQVGAA